MCSQSAPFLIIRVHSAVRLPKSEASTEGATFATGEEEEEDMLRLWLCVSGMLIWDQWDGRLARKSSLSGMLATETSHTDWAGMPPRTRRELLAAARGQVMLIPTPNTTCTANGLTI